MLVKKWQEIEEYDLGSILGKPELGIKVKKITNRGIMDKVNNYNFEIEHYVLDSGKSALISIPGINYMLAARYTLIQLFMFWQNKYDLVAAAMLFRQESITGTVTVHEQEYFFAAGIFSKI